MTSDSETPIQYLKERIAEFAHQREWEQFHSPKNLSMALAVEAAEVMELFQWKTEQETVNLRSNPKMFRRVREELADVAIYLLNLCNRLDIDLAIAIVEKLAQNARKYPPDLAKSTSQKYTDLGRAPHSTTSAINAPVSPWRQLEFDLEVMADSEHSKLSMAVESR